MPIVHVNLIEDAFDSKEKQRVIEGITDVFASIKGEDFRQLVVAVIHEVESGDVGKGGKLVTLEKVRSLAATS